MTRTDSPDSACWYADGLCFTCTQCGRCCGGAPGHVFVSEQEIARIARLLKMDAQQFRRRHTRRAGSRRSLRELPNGDCEFLGRDADGRAYCRIYAARPLQCRTWPFWASNLRSEADWALAARECPGINTGRHHPLPVIRQALARNRAARLPL